MPTKEETEQALRVATDKRKAIQDNMHTPLDRALANAEFYATIRKAVDADVLTLQEIANLTDISRQRVWQIVRTPQVARRLQKATLPPPAPAVRLPETDV